MSRITDIKEIFDRDIRQHQINIKHDSGLYRDIYCGDPATVVMSFNISTVPGRLIYAGDMGCFVFERLPDMFNFFRKNPDEDLPFDYWHQKLIAVDRLGSLRHSVEAFKENLESYLDESLNKYELLELREFIKNVVKVYDYEGPDEAYRQVYAFEFSNSNKKNFFADFFELSDKVYTHHYLWACHAIAWAIQQYDQLTSKDK